MTAARHDPVGGRSSRTSGLVLRVAILGAAAVTLPQFVPLNLYYTSLLTTAATYGLAVLGLVVVTGYAGQISLAQGMFFGIGAYALGLGTTKWHWSFWMAVIVGLGAALLLGAVLGGLTLRVGGHYLAMATLAIQLIFSLVLVNWISVTNGSDGILGIPRPTLLGFSYDDSHSFLGLVSAILIVVGGGVVWLSRSRIGRSMVATREDELAAEVAGVPTLAIKVMAFCVSGVLASLGGAMFASSISYVSPDEFNFNTSILLLAMTLIGGSTSVIGASLGAFALVLLPEWLTFLGSVYYGIYGLALLAVIIYMPQGFGGFIIALWHRRFPARTELPTMEVPIPGRSTDGHVFVEVRDLRKRFGGVVAVDGVDMELRSGEVHALIGPNGSGKTTMINLISGVYRPTSGRILFEDKDLAGMPPHRISSLGITRTFQLIRLCPTLTVIENVRVGVGAGPLQRAEEDRAWAALRIVGADDFAGQEAASLPQGHRKLVEIARALNRGPKLIMLDEPAGGLNSQEKNHLAAVIQEIKALGIAVLLVEHDMSFVRRVADYTTVLHNGRTLAHGLTQDVLVDELVVSTYLGDPRRGNA